MKKKTPQQEIEHYASEIVKESELWQSIKKNGCNDPGYPDGVDLNLVRNHISYYKHEIRRICGESGLPIPDEAFIPTPPYTDCNYFAKPKSERAQIIMKWPYWQGVNLEQPGEKFDADQMSLL